VFPSPRSSAMNLALQAVFALLCTECFVIAVFTVPWPDAVRRMLLNAVSKSSLLALAAKPAKYFFFGLLAFWASTTRDMVKMQSEHSDHEFTDLSVKLEFEVRMFRTQRDFYLIGFSALLLLVIGRFYSVFKEVNSLAATKEALKRQADQAVAAFKGLQEENESLKKSSGASAAPKETPETDTADAAGAEGKDVEEAVAEVAKLKSDKEALERMVEAARAERDSGVKQAEAVKKQAEGLSNEYMRLQAENESLKNKLADYDDLMGDAVKKSK